MELNTDNFISIDSDNTTVLLLSKTSTAILFSPTQTCHHLRIQHFSIIKSANKICFAKAKNYHRLRKVRATDLIFHSRRKSHLTSNVVLCVERESLMIFRESLGDLNYTSSLLSCQETITHPSQPHHSDIPYALTLKLIFFFFITTIVDLHTSSSTTH